MKNIKSHAIIKFIHTLILTLCLPSLLFASGSYYNRLPELGDSSQTVMTTLQERELGKKFFKMVKRALPLEQDAIINDYIQNLGYQLVAYSPRPSVNFKFFVVSSPEINAFAGPDGYIGINSGLILRTTTESELASVIAHEIAHVAQRHITRGLVQQKNIQLSSLVALLAAIAIGTQNPNAGTGALSAVTAGGYQHMLNFSRGFEKEADRVGMQIMAGANYDPRSMPTFFGRLAKESMLNGGDNIPEFLRTHPVTENRIADANNRANQYPKFKPRNNFMLHLIQARIIANLSRDPMITARRCKEKLHASRTYNASLHYAYALTLLRAHQTQAALKQINPLIQKYPNQVLFKMAKAQIEEAAHHSKQAIYTLKNLYQYNSDYYPLLLLYSKILIENQEVKQALKILLEQKESYGNHIGYLHLLSKAQAYSGQKGASHETRAKMYQTLGEPKLAIQQLRIALQFAKDSPYHQRIIKTRIKELNNEKDT